jgi:hypothetical protein
MFGLFQRPTNGHVNVQSYRIARFGAIDGDRHHMIGNVDQNCTPFYCVAHIYLNI